MKSAKEWYDLMKLLRLTTNSALLRSILLSSLTVGMPEYKVEFDMNCETQKQICVDVSRVKVTKVAGEERSPGDDDLAGNKQRSESIGRELETGATSLMLLGGNGLDEQDPSSFSAFYETTIDFFLDLNETPVDLATMPYNDSVNLMLATRSIVLIDLIQHLGDDELFANCAFKLSLKILDIINQVIH